jgi:hypothetical protein
MREQESALAEKHASRKQRVNADDVEIKFSPEVVRSLTRLEALLHDSPHYSSDLLENLRDLASGKPQPVQIVLTEMALITRETMRHVQATGDKRAAEALRDFHEALMADPASKTCTVIVAKSRSR